MNKLAIELLGKYGLPTVLALALLYALVRLGNAVLIDMRGDIDHLARMVDLSCEPKGDARFDDPAKRSE